MTRSLIVLALALLALGVIDRLLAGSAAKQRIERNRVGQLLSEEEREDLRMAAIRVRTNAGDYLYARVQGMWRCLGYHEAPAQPEAIQGLVDKLVQAEGIVQTEDVDDAPEYGINTPETVQVLLCGPRVLEDPGGDVLVAFDVGLRTPGRDGAFVRRQGTKAIWAIDGDPLVELERRPADGLPPLLEPGVVPSAWPGWSRGLAQVFVDLQDGTSLVLERRFADVDPANLKPGQAPWVWVLDPGPNERPAAEQPAVAYSLFLQRAPYLEVLDRDRQRELVLDQPHHVITLAAAEGDPLQVHLGPPLPDGGAPVWVPFSQTLFRIPAEVVPLLAPPPRLFAEGAVENPWDPYLR